MSNMRLVVASCILGFLWSGTAFASGIALVISGEDAPSDIANAVEQFLVSAAAYYPEQRIVTGPLARKKLKKEVAKCKSETTCVAKRAAKLKFDAVVLGHIHRGDELGAQLDIATIITATHDRVRPHTFAFASASDVAPTLAKSFFAIMGITTPGELEIVGAASLTAHIDGEEKSLADGRISLPPGSHSVTVYGTTMEVLVLPHDIKRVQLAEFGAPDATPTKPEEIETTPSEPEEIEAVVVATPNPPEQVVAQPVLVEQAPTKQSSARLLRYAGLGVAVAGGVTCGVGIYLGSQAKVSITPTTTQAQAQRLNNTAEKRARTANVILASGGAALAIGGLAWVLGALVLPDQIPIAVVPTAGGASVTLFKRF